MNNKEHLNKEHIAEPPKIPKPEIIKKPLEFNNLTDYSNITNILLIDNKVKNFQDFFNNVNDTTYPIIYDVSSQSDELINILKNFVSINRIAFVFDELYLNGTKFFINNAPFFVQNDLVANEINQLSSNAQLLINICNQYSVKNIDFLACNSLTYSNWTKYYNQLNFFTKNESNKNGVTIGASDDKTGNIKYGGDWIMESDGQNIEYIYFTNGITNYAYTLANSPISVNTSVEFKNLDNYYIQFSADNGSWTTINGTTYDWPVTIINNNAPSTNIIVKLTNLNINTAIGAMSGINAYFIAGSDNIIFDGGWDGIGTYYTTTINGITDYPGLISNGNGGANQFYNIKVQNINMDSVNSTLSDYGGWICQQYFGYGYLDVSLNPSCIILNCASNGNITNNYCGGIVGPYSTASVSNCYNTGNFIENHNYGGGIIGSYCISGNVTNCYSAGDFTGDDNYGGGINGYSCSSCAVTNCYSIGNFTGNYNNGGGINGASCISCIVTNCYNVGNFTRIGNSGGGINGASCTSCIVTNCYNIGNFTGTSNSGGGINGNSCNSCTVTNCYSTGNFAGASNYGGGINGIGCSSCDVKNCYSTGNFTGTNNNGGGINGHGCTSCTVINCYSTGDFTGASNYSGGINGNSCKSCTVTNCYSTGDFTGTNNSGGGINGYSCTSCITSYCYTLYTTITGSDSTLCVNNHCSYYNSNPGTWLNSDATYTTEHPKGLLKVGTVWILNNESPFLLSSFNTNFYNGITQINSSINNWTNLTLTIPNNSYDKSTGTFLLLPSTNNPSISSDSNSNFGQLISNNYGTFTFKVLFTYTHNLSYVGYNIIDFTLSITRGQNNVGFDFREIQKNKHKKNTSI